MIIVKTFCECGKEVDSGLTIGRQRHVKMGNADILTTPMTMFTHMTCPECGRNLGYIGKEVPEGYKCYSQRNSYLGGK